jgi:type II secretory pathway predicted ATPase ExeA
MYYEYWGLNKPPFDNVPDPSMFVECHPSLENAMAETVFAIEEGNDCLAVIVGDVGLGKTLSFRMMIDSLDQQKYKIALITNPDMSFVQLLREIIGQLTGKQCEINKKIDLLECFNKLLFETIDEGRKVLIFIDEANALSPSNLENLRLLTNMQDDKKNLLTIVLAGQAELARRLENPRRANLFQRIGTYCTLDKIQSEDMVKTYVETRLQLSGGTRPIFSDDAFGYIYEYSDHGIPRLINKICKLCLKAGETNKLQQINADMVKEIGERLRRLTSPALKKRRQRKRPAMGIIKESAQELEKQSEELLSHTEMPVPELLPEQAGAPMIGESSEEAPPPSKEISKEASIERLNIKIDIPLQIFEQARSSPKEYCSKLAGALAAQTLKQHPELTASPSVDLVSLWSEIRELVLHKLEQGREEKSSSG